MLNPKLRILAILCLALLLWTIFLILRPGTPTGARVEQPKPAKAPATASSIKNRAKIMAAVASKLTSAATPPTPSTPLPFAPSDLILRARAGSFTPQDVTAAVAAFNARTPEALAEITRLATSSVAAERLLSLYLRLELDGPTPAILASAATDASPWISSQAAEWLYFHCRFDLWNDYVEGVRAAWTLSKTGQVIASLAADSTGSPELSAGLVILQLGRALPDMVGALLNTAPELRVQLEAALLDPATDSTARTALLGTFQEARPPDYLTTLEKLIAARGEDSPARFKAFVYYAEAAGAADGQSWLNSAAPSSTPADPLAFRFDLTKRLLVKKAAVPLAQMRANTRDQITVAVTSATFLRELSESDLRTLDRYVEQLRDFPPERADAPTLERIAALLEAEPFRDYSARRFTARVRALANQAAL